MARFYTKIQNSILVSKWGRYWQDLIKDYSDVIKESAEQAKNQPRKTALICTLLGISLVSVKTNPNEQCYRDCLLKCSNDVLLVAKPVRNQKTDQFLNSVEACFNQGLVRRLSLGIFSVLWLNNYDHNLGIYQSKCYFLEPKHSTFFNRIIDIGFFGKWWRLDTIMEDYDVNAEEWDSENRTSDKA